MKKNKNVSWSAGLLQFIASPKFFYGVITFFILCSAWIAISSLYPMAFDEDFHVGMIRLYAEHWGPFAISQTPEANKFGSVVTDPSYVYHYLMSFPYRLLDAVTDSEMAIVITLRLMNVAMFAWALWLYRKVLLNARVRPGITHVVLAIFVLIPVVPLLAGQINYDNLLMVIIAGSLLQTIDIRTSLKNHKSLPAKPLLYLILLLLFGSVIKYAFLPVAVGIAGYVLYLVWRMPKRKALLRDTLKDSLGMSKASKVGIGLALAVLLILAGQRYGTNLVKYHDPVPDCGKVLTTEQCLEYGPWGRDHRYSQDLQGMTAKNPISYTIHDFSWGMWQRLFFTLAGPTNSYQTRKPLPIISISSIVLAVVGVVLALVYSRSIFKQYPIFWLFVITAAIYLFAVWLQVYQLHSQTARPVAINGRYLLPFLPLLGAIMAVAYYKFFVQFNLQRYIAAGIVVVFLLFLQGGGPITYIVRSEPTWFWPNSWMQDVNGTLKSGLKPLMYRGVSYFER